MVDFEILVSTLMVQSKYEFDMILCNGNYLFMSYVIFIFCPNQTVLTTIYVAVVVVVLVVVTISQWAYLPILTLLLILSLFLGFCH